MDGSKGEGGVIRKRLRAFCDRFGDYLDFTRGEKTDGNSGVTEVRILKPVPNALERLAERGVDYCRTGRTMSEIEGKFRQSGASVARDVVALLKKQGRLEKTHKRGGRTVYLAR